MVAACSLSLAWTGESNILDSLWKHWQASNTGIAGPEVLRSTKDGAGGEMKRQSVFNLPLDAHPMPKIWCLHTVVVCTTVVLGTHMTLENFMFYFSDLGFYVVDPNHASQIRWGKKKLAIAESDFWPIFDDFSTKLAEFGRK
jgi:hypothetical protein